METASVFSFWNDVVSALSIVNANENATSADARNYRDSNPGDRGDYGASGLGNDRPIAIRSRCRCL